MRACGSTVRSENRHQPWATSASAKAQLGFVDLGRGWLTVAGKHALAVTLGMILVMSFTASFAAELSSSERSLILAHAGWPPPWQRDDSNRASGSALAAAAGKVLFFEPALSRDATMSCASCHLPNAWFTDARARAKGRKLLPRNSPTIVDSRWKRWLGWGGAHDNLWSQSLRALLSPQEMHGNARAVTQLVRADIHLACALERAFDVELDKLSEPQTLVLAGKALAAYQETIVSGPSPFDNFAHALRENDQAGMDTYPKLALSGLKLFVGEGRCNLCHLGPRFSNNEFADVAVPYFVDGGVDKGRYAGIKILQENPYNRLGEFSDSRSSMQAKYTEYVALKPRNFGEFAVPSLRNVARTGPYMHDGSLATLAGVVNHYSELNEERLHGNGAQLVRALRLSATQAEALVAFLKSLTSAALMPVAGLDIVRACK